MVWEVGAYIIIIALAIVGPLVFDMYMSYGSNAQGKIGSNARGKIGNLLRPSLSTSKETNEVKDESKDGSKDNTPSSGIPGLARTLMTFGIILIVALISFHILSSVTLSNQPLSTVLDSINHFMSNQSNNLSPTNKDTLVELTRNYGDSSINLNNNFIEILKTIMIIFGGAVSAMIGFYFGQKSAEAGSKIAESAVAAAKSSTDAVLKGNGRSKTDGTIVAGKDKGALFPGISDVTLKETTDSSKTDGTIVAGKDKGALFPGISDVVLEEEDSEEEDSGEEDGGETTDSSKTDGMAGDHVNT